jgi:hypothetical protein
MNDTAFQAWLLIQGYDQQSWIPGLLRALKRRFEKSHEKSQERIVVDGDCRWPQRTYRVNRTVDL